MHYTPHMEDIVYTIGHSTHPIDEFLELLRAYEIRLLADVRTVPGSRRNPQFNQAPLEQFLREHEVDYVHLKELGGLRRTTKDSINTGWRNLSFRGYADYMQTEEFRSGIERLMELARARRTVIMCAEAVPWRCHRSLIGDALVVRGVRVLDIMSATSAKPHELTAWARVDGDSITYPATDAETPASKPKRSKA